MGWTLKEVINNLDKVIYHARIMNSFVPTSSAFKLKKDKDDLKIINNSYKKIMEKAKKLKSSLYHQNV